MKVKVSYQKKTGKCKECDGEVTGLESLHNCRSCGLFLVRSGRLSCHRLGFKSEQLDDLKRIRFCAWPASPWFSSLCSARSPGCRSPGRSSLPGSFNLSKHDVLHWSPSSDSVIKIRPSSSKRLSESRSFWFLSKLILVLLVVYSTLNEYRPALASVMSA